MLHKLFVLPKHFFPQACSGGPLLYAEPYFANPRYVAQEKLDGARYIIHKDMSGKVRIYSRQISRVTGEPVDKTQQLRHLADEADRILPSGTVLDGEVVASVVNSSSNLVTKVTGSKPDRALEVQEKHGFLEFKAFDILALQGEVLTDSAFETRYSLLTEPTVFMYAWDQKKFISVLPVVGGEAEMRALYDEVVKRGGEGIILKDLDAPYEQGKRSKRQVKVKRQRTFDVVFLGIELAEEASVKKGDDRETSTRIAGLPGAIVYGQYVEKPVGEGMLADLGTVLELERLGTVAGFDDAVRADLGLNTAVYAKARRVLEVTAQEQFASGALRHPRFVQWRDDKRAEDCVFRPDEG